MKRLAIITFLILASLHAYAQRQTISGHMTDGTSGEPLIGAAVLDITSGQGTVTNNFGFYTLTLPAGTHSLEFSHIGYNTERRQVQLLRDTTINIAFRPDAEFLTGAVVTASRSETGVRGTQMSAIEVPVNVIKSVPAIGGEVDILKTLQLLPGVQSGTEGSAGMYVRGGGPDENLLLLDGVPLYNVNHMMGFFSVFDAEAVKNVTLYKGSFPARFGSRLSSVVDVRMKDGNDQEYHGGFTAGLIAAKFNLEGPIVKGRTTFNISARRTYYDLLVAPILYFFRSDFDADKLSAGYYFYDVNLKLTHKFSDRDKLFASFYTGDDAVYAGIGFESRYNTEMYSEGRMRTVTAIDESNLDLGWQWGNTIGALRWNHVFSPKLFLNTTLNYTRYRHKLVIDMLENNRYENKGKVLMQGDTSQVKMSYNSEISDISVGTDFEYTPSPDHDVRFGLNATYHDFNPSVTSMYTRFTQDSDPGSKIDTTFGDKPVKTWEAALYAEDNFNVTRWLKLNLGLRYSLYSVSGRTYHSLEPRVSMRALLTDDLSLKASYTEMSQYIHLLSNSNLSLPTDLWVPVTANIEPMRSRQAAFGVFYSLGVVDFSLEGYYKTMNNLIEYRDGASFLGTTTGWEQKVAVGRGWAYGVELLAQKSVGRTTGWIGYTLSRSVRVFDREGNMINYGKPFPAKYDRRHDLSIVVTHKFDDHFDISGTFVFGSGVCGSLATSQIAAPMDGLLASGDINHDLGIFTSTSYLEGRNNYRLPAYNRLDICAAYHFGRRLNKTISLNVYNAYNAQNPFLVYRDTESTMVQTTAPDGSVSVEYASRPVLKQLSIFPIMPSLSFSYKF